MNTSRPLKALVAILVAIAAYGCSTSKTALNSKGKGLACVYDASFEAVWAAIPRVVQQHGESWGTQIINENPTEGYFLLGSRRVQLTEVVIPKPSGESTAVFVKRLTETRTRVEVVSRNRYVMSPSDRAIEVPRELHRKIAALYRMVE
jgi:hypothetical protein